MTVKKVLNKWKRLEEAVEELTIHQAGDSCEKDLVHIDRAFYGRFEASYCRHSVSVDDNIQYQGVLLYSLFRFSLSFLFLLQLQSLSFLFLLQLQSYVFPFQFNL